MNFHRLAFPVLIIAAQIHAATPVPDPDNGGLTLPPGFRALVVADNLMAGRKVGRSTDNLRFLAVAPNGDVYAKTYHGGIIALHDADGDGRFETKQEFGTGGGTGIAFHNGWLYHSTNSAVYRYKYTPGQLVPAGEPQLIVGGLPDEHNTHNAKSFAFDDRGRMLVEVGSPFNVLSDGDRAKGAKGKDATEFLKTHGGFWRFDPDKQNQTLADGYHFSTGHRHSLALAWNNVSKNFFMVMMGRDQLNTIDPVHYNEMDNAERVAEEMHLLREGVNLGWPYTYWDPLNKARMVAPEFGGDNSKRAEPGKYDAPVIAFPGHWAPLQMTFYNATQFPAKYRGGAFIAFHGSWNRAPLPQAGYRVAFVPFNDKGMPVGDYETFANNFAGREVIASPRDARFRPGGLAVGPDGSLYVGDTEKGRIWRIIYTGDTAPVAAAPAQELPAVKKLPDSAVSNKAGQALYTQYCAACHMVDGGGAAPLQPALAGSAVVSGAPAQVVDVILRGPAVALPADRPKYTNVMPPWSMLDDKQVADIVSYIRQAFANGASAVTPEDVAKVRKAHP